MENPALYLALSLNISFYILYKEWIIINKLVFQPKQSSVTPNSRSSQQHRFTSKLNLIQSLCNTEHT